MNSLWGCSIPPRGSACIAQTLVQITCQELDAYSPEQIDRRIAQRAEMAACRLRVAVMERQEAVSLNHHEEMIHV